MAETESAAGKGLSKFAVRTMSTVFLLCVLVGVMWGGHIPCAFVMFTFQALIVKELFEIARNVDEDKTMPLFRTQQWNFFIVASFYLYGRFVRKNLSSVAMPGPRAARVVSWLLSRHPLISFSLYTCGLVLFILTLQQGKYAYQFKQIAWTHLIVFFTVVPSSFYVPLMFEGLVWFFLPCALIIVNDIMAYLAGRAFGRTPLIQLSPKKTWEGFVGGAVGTMAASCVLAWVFSKFEWMYCPRDDLSFGVLHCDKPNAFVPAKYHLDDLWQCLPDFLFEELQSVLALAPQALKNVAQELSWTCMPAQMHAIVLGMFASIIGPFGGFFASGFKRAFGVKDFGDSIPGHGGVTDRFDCQMPMAVFSYLYFHMYIAEDHDRMAVMEDILDLTDNKKLSVFIKLGEMLVMDGLLPADLYQECFGNLTLPTVR